jgi:queuine tRNA-ribosyltransferase
VSDRFAFEVIGRDGGARRGRLRLPHGVVETPAFMPVGTRGAIKALTLDALEAMGAEILLANTYHLHVRPGDERIARLGGLHAFTSWPRPILTDSGGYQVFSLAARRRVTEDAVLFQSHLDGRALELSPERAVDIQARLGSDIAMMLDECPSWPATHAEAEASMSRTVRWAARGRARFQALGTPAADGVAVSTPGQAQFGIIQGGTFQDLRDQSVERTVGIGFEGYAIGGLSVGEPTAVMYEVAAATASSLPDGQPRYLMGTGMPDDLIECVARGIDLFDCVLPTRNARNGQLFTRRGPIAIKNARFAEDDRPPDDACGCATCRRYSRAYLRHLFVSGEMTGAALNTLHNLHFYLDTMRAIRKAIEFGNFEAFRTGFLEAYARRRSHS